MLWQIELVELISSLVSDTASYTIKKVEEQEPHPTLRPSSSSQSPSPRGGGGGGRP